MFADFFKAAWPLILNAWNWLRKKCYAHRVGLTVTIVIGTALYVGLFMYQETYKKEIVILAGPDGSSSLWDAKWIAEELRKTERIPTVKYAVRVEQTNGVDEIEERINSDFGGDLIGFTHNRPGDPTVDHINIVLPLDYDYLHILCRARFLAERFGEDAPQQFDAVVESLGPGRVFAGPPGSTSRTLAAALFERYGRNAAELQKTLHPAINDWVEARAALANDMVDLVFFTGPIGATTVERIALYDQSAVLLGLNDIQSALVRHESYALHPVDFPKHCYTAKKLTVASPRRSRFTSLVDLLTGRSAASIVQDLKDAQSPSAMEFCPEGLKTIAARRLIVCSPSMKPADAYVIAQTAKKALGSDSQVIGEWGAVPPEAESQDKKDALGFGEHPGAKTEPSSWWKPQSWSVFWASVSPVLLFLFIQFVSSLQTRETPTEGNNSGTPIHELPVSPVSPFMAWSAIIERKIDDLGMPPGTDEIQRGKEFVAATNQEIDSLKKVGQLTDKQTEVLREGLEKFDGKLESSKIASHGQPATVEEK